MNDADNASMRLYFTRGWAIEFFFQNLLAAPKIYDLYHMNLGNNKKKTFFCHFPSVDGQKTKMAEF